MNQINKHVVPKGEFSFRVPLASQVNGTKQVTRRRQ